MSVPHQYLLQHLENVLQLMRWSRLQLGLSNTEDTQDLKTQNSHHALNVLNFYLWIL